MRSVLSAEQSRVLRDELLGCIDGFVTAGEAADQAAELLRLKYRRVVEGSRKGGAALRHDGLEAGPLPAGHYDSAYFFLFFARLSSIGIGLWSRP